MSMKCVFCNNKKLYILKSGQAKCSLCKKKFSPKKMKKDLELIECFIQNMTANQTATKLELNYITVKKSFHILRKLIANYLEEEYRDKTVFEYDEYVYLEKSKKKIKENIFDAQNFLTFHYEDKVYNLLMPNLNRHKNQFLNDEVDKAYFQEFSKFMMFNKISKIQKKDNIITQFWLFFENSILKYKGIKHENFFYYLKEIEFKFNYTPQEQLQILNHSLYKYF
ncbi:MAG: transposase [Sulfurimonas sp.]|jgi:transposase